MRDPRSALIYEVYPQLDALGVDGVARLLDAFGNIEAEAQSVAQAAFDAYGQIPGEGDMADFADSANDEGIEYYRTLSEMKQGVTNLLAVGLYHLYEQHRDRIKTLVAASGNMFPDVQQFTSWPKVYELKCLANTVKHGDGDAAAKLRTLRPEYFVDPMLRGSPLARMIEQNPRPVTNPIGGTDLFVDRRDLVAYRDALRTLWEEILPHL